MKIESKIGSHQINPEWSAQKTDMNKIISRSLPIQGKGERKSSFSSMIPNEKESQRVTQTAFGLFSKIG